MTITPIRHRYQGLAAATNIGRRMEQLISNTGFVGLATTTSGSPTVTITTATLGLIYLGQLFVAAGVPDGTTVLAYGTSAGGTGTITLSANATATTASPIAVTTSYRANLVGEYLFGRDAATSAINMASSANPLTFAGTPVFAARYATFDQADWADTHIYDNQELTLLVVCAVTTATAPLITNYNGGNTTDLCHFNLNATQFGAIVSDSTGTQQSPTQAFNAHTPKTDFSIKALRTTGSANFVVKNSELRAGALIGTSTKTTTATRKVTTTAPFAIGSCRGSSSFAGTSQVAGAAIFQRSLSDAELLALSAAITATMAAWPQGGITC